MKDKQRTVLKHCETMKYSLIAVIALIASTVQGFAASVTNNDGSAVVIVVVEGENKMEVALEPGASEEICPAGCFITTPNGDRLGLVGNETIVISNGSAVVK